jgi:hypothetical protein
METIIRCKKRICHLEAIGIPVVISWTPGHANIAGNEIADKLAKQASQAAASMDQTRPTSQGDIRGGVRVSVKAKWQRQWDASESGRGLYNLKPSVTGHKLIDVPNPPLYSKIAQLRLGYLGLNKYLYAIGQADSPECEDCREEETVEHYLLHCDRFRDPRDRLSSKIFNLCGEWILSLDMLLGVSEEDKYRDIRVEICELLGDYIVQSSRF